MGLRKQELKPTKENLISTLKQNAIDRNGFLRRFITLLNTIDEATSIAIDGRWGDGKTFFVKQAKMVIDANNPNVDNDLSEEEKKTVCRAIETSEFYTNDLVPQVTIYYDAWTNDNDVDPLLSIVYEISKSMIVEFPKIDSAGLLEKAAAIFDLVTGLNIGSKTMTVEEKYKKIDLLESIKNQKSIQEIVSNYLDELLPEQGNRLVIFIDELDRCRPTFAVQLLERIKHYFDNDRITFVFTINTDELHHSIRQFYGAEFDACRYLDRFFDFRIELPPANIEKYLMSIGINEVGIVTSDTVCSLVCLNLGMGMRETEKLFRIARIAANKIYNGVNAGIGFNNEGYYFSCIVIVPIVIGLSMADRKKYNDFIEGKDYQPLVDTLDGYIKSPRICEHLLCSGEAFSDSYDSQKSDEGLVDLKERLKQAYDAVFNNNSNSNITVGRCLFNNTIKRQVIEISSMLSENAKYEE